MSKMPMKPKETRRFQKLPLDMRLSGWKLASEERSERMKHASHAKRPPLTAESLEAVIYGGRRLIGIMAGSDRAGPPYRTSGETTTALVPLVEAYPDLRSMLKAFDPPSRALVLGAIALDESFLPERTRKDALRALIESARRCKESRRMLRRLGFSNDDILYMNHQMSGKSGSFNIFRIAGWALMGWRRRRETLERAMYEVEKAYDLIVVKEAREQGKNPIDLLDSSPRDSPGDCPWGKR